MLMFKHLSTGKKKLNKLHKKYPYLNVYANMDVMIEDKEDKNYGKWRSQPYNIKREDK